MGKFLSILTDREKRVLALLQDSWLRLLAAMFYMMIIAATTAATAFLVKNMLDDIFVEQDERMLTLLPIGIAFIFLLRGVALFGKDYYMSYVGEAVIKKLRDNLYDRIMDLSLAFFHKEKTGVLMSRITNDVNIVKNMVSTSVTGAIEYFFTMVGLIMVIFYRDWKMALYAFTVLPLAFWGIVAIGKRIRRISTGCQVAMAELNSFLHETFAGTKIVKAFGMEEYEKKRFFEKTQKLFRLDIKAVVSKSLTSPVMEVATGFGVGFIIWYGGSRVFNGTTTPGTFMSFMTAVLLLYSPAKKIAKLNNSVQTGLAAADRIFDILDTRSDIEDHPDAIELEKISHSVRFDAVSFRYQKDDVLKGINIHAKPGEIIALVGESGGGKSTLVNLIPRFFDVTKGQIAIDNTDIRKIKIASVREQIALVTQDSILFNDTIRNNIAYGNRDATEEEILTAAKAAFAHDFVMRFPEQFDTMIGELGNRLSGGEKQRVCIARALLKNAPILILDEATSALDATAEQLVQQALENLMKGRTTFVIAHRLSTIRFADRIIVIDGGRIVEEGKHEDLLQKQGKYFELYNMQFEMANAE
ncbi:MAG: ATP-binding cassette domain-containing protein [Proteobacteria bacterium]|nr:ATP-binding cassette domain-containing protein [Pseudomonadota bacterium]